MTALLIVIIVTRVMSFLAGLDTMLGPKPDQRSVHIVGLLLDGGLIGWSIYLLTQM